MFNRLLSLSKEVIHKVIEMLVTLVDNIIDFINIFKKKEE